MATSPTLPSRFLVYGLFALLLAAAAWFYTWAPASFPIRWTSKEPTGFYAELTQAFLGGHLYLARAPDPRLITLADPYDPAQNAPFRVNNLSYFKGRYYLYHGAAPVLTLLAPFRLLTGRYLTDSTTAVLFCLGGAAFSLLLLTETRRRLLPAASVAMLVCCGFVATFGHGYYLVLRNPATNQVAIASAYFFLTLGAWSAFRALSTSRSAWPWLLVVATACSLAIASRPNYVFGAAGLLVPLVYLWHRDGSQRSCTFWRNLAALGLPIALVVGGLLIHNYLRFGQLLEFGQRYMLGAWDQRALGFMELRSLPANASHYLFSPGNFSAEFPFLTAPSWQAIGVLVQAPFVWLVLSAAGLWFNRSEPLSAGALRALAGMLALILVCNLGLLLFLPSGNDQAVLTSANARYTFDFLPAWVLLTCIGVLSLDHRLAGTRWLRRCWRVGVLALALASLLGALSLDFQRLPPECYRPLAQTLNWPTHLAQRWLSTTYGPVKLEVVFPPGKPHYYEPLVATGTAAAGDLLYVFYDSPETVRFGLVGTAMKGPLSPPIPVTYGQPHRLEIHMGSLYPPSGNPVLSSLGDTEVARLKRTLRVDLDGRTVFEVPAHFFPSKPRHVQIGSTTILRDYCLAEFSGQILTTGRLPITPLETARQTGPEYGAIRLVLRFPDNKPGVSEPLVVSGVQGAGDLIYVQYVDNRQISLGLDHWGHMGLRTTWLPVDYSVDHIMEIQMGALFPPTGHILFSELKVPQVEGLKGRVRIVLDGEVVLDAEQPTFDSSPYDVFIGRNAIGGSTCIYEFSGEIKSASRLPLPAVGGR